MEVRNEIICQAFGGTKSKETIDLVLKTFLSEYEELGEDYAFKPEDEEYVFKTEQEMINYFIERNGIEQCFYWNKESDNPEKIMVGANITRDNKLIMSLTMYVTDKTGKIYLNRLKQLLQTNIGVLTYTNPAEYEDGGDFILKYS